MQEIIAWIQHEAECIIGKVRINRINRINRVNRINRINQKETRVIDSIRTINEAKKISWTRSVPPLRKLGT